MNSLLDAGAAEQANRVQFEIGKLQAEASAYGSYASAQASVQNALIGANAQIQSQLISSTAMLEANRMSFVGDQLDNLYNENVLGNQQRTNALLLPYEQFNRQVGVKTRKGQGSDPLAGLGTAIGGAASLAGTFFGGPAGAAATALPAAGVTLF